MTEPDHKAVALIERGQMPEIVHPLVKAAMEQGSLDDLEKLMALQERHEANEARRRYTAAMVELKTDLPTIIHKDSVVDFKSSKGRTYYRHASLAGVMDAITDPLTRHGFSLTYQVANDQQVSVTCRLTHSAGHFEESTLSAAPDSTGGKNPVQQVASTVTYLQRYTALALLGIATADMPEPKGETPADHVDSSVNLRAVRAVVASGLTRENAEEFLSKQVQEWTAEDLKRLRVWLDEKKEPAHDPGTGEVIAKLQEVLTGIQMADSQSQLEAIAPWIKKSGLNDAEIKQARDAYSARRKDLDPGD